MKKLFILLLSAVALVAFTSSAFALHGVKDLFEYNPTVVKSNKAMLEIGGYFRVRGETADNYTDFDDDVTSGGDKSHWDSKIMFNVKATVSPNTFGYIQIQNNNENSDSYTWGKCTAVNAGTYQRSNCKPSETIMFRQAYIAHEGTGLLGQLAGFKVGHMLLSLGDGVFFNHSQFGDDALILWMQPNDNTEFSFITIKAVEGSNSLATDDVDFYVLTGATEAGGFNISGDLTYVDDKPTGRSAASPGGLTLWNLGLRGSGDVGGGVTLSADVEFQTGEIENAAAAGGDYDLSGLAIVVKASAKVGDITIRGQVGYGSGDDVETTDEYEGFITSLSQGQRYTYLYDQKATTAAQSIATALTGATASTQGGGNTGVANTVYVGIGASTNVNPDVKVSGDVWYLEAAQEWSGLSGADDTDIGIEVDGKVTYQIDTNLVWYLEAGYLFAGDFYKNITAAGVDPDDAYSVRHGIVLTF